MDEKIQRKIRAHRQCAITTAKNLNKLAVKVQKPIKSCRELKVETPEAFSHSNRV